MSAENNQAILTIKSPFQYGVVWEDPKNMSASIYCSIYSDALKNVCDIISANEKLDPNTAKFAPEQLNTVISFVGKRGSGKSTVMSNFAQILGKVSGSYDLSWVKDTSLDDDAINKIKSVNFRVLNVIDSAQLGTKETIIGRISAAMYTRYKEIATSNEPQLSVEQKRNFLANLSNVNKYAVMYHTGDWFKVEEGLLDNTCHVSSLKSEMSNMVRSYLKFVTGKAQIDNEYLVVSIDDLDMSIENSYSIMEEIRKFLCIPNLIVLVTLRMDQIYLAMRSKYEQQLGGKVERINDKALIEDLAYRYAEKLFPYDRQHHMPTLTTKQLQEEWIADFGINFPKEDNGYCKCILHSIIYLLWRKTLLILICDMHGDHLLVPRNLRSLCQMVGFLQKLPDVDYAKLSERTNSSTLQADRNTLKNNLHEFYQYLVTNVHSFEHEYIYDEDKRFADVLLLIIQNIEYMPLKHMNANIAGDILHYLQGQKESHYYKIFNEEIVKPNQGTIDGTSDNQDKNDEKSRSHLDVILAACGQPDRISLGDLMFVLGKIDSKTRCRYIKYLIEIIRTLWSIRMTEEYFSRQDGKSNTTKYADVIGNLIVNPDVGFFERKKSDLITFDKPNKAFEVFIVSHNIDDWREGCLRSAEPNCKTVYHPLAPLLRKIFRDQLPLYSFDFAYRFYEFLHNNAPQKDYFRQQVIGLYEKVVLKSIGDMLVKNNENKWIVREGIINEEIIKQKCAEIRDVIGVIKCESDFRKRLNRCATVKSIKNLINEIYKYDISLIKAKQISNLKIAEDAPLSQIKGRILDLLDDRSNDAERK